MTDLPSDWSVCSLKDLGIDQRAGYWGKAPGEVDDGVPARVVRNGDVDASGGLRVAKLPERHLSARELERAQLEVGDVLVTTSGDVGKVARWDLAAARASSVPGATSNFVRRLRPADGALAAWLYYYLRSPAVQERFKHHARGVAIQNLAGQFWKELTVPVAPAAIRDEIVAALDSYLSRLDDAVANLERVQRNLKRYRASVLKAAVEGRLVPTEAELARAEGRDYEPASDLLERILTERRRRWEDAELAKMLAKGKPPKKDKWKTKYKEPAEPDLDGLPELPEGWCWATVEQLEDGARRCAYGVLVPGPDVANGVPMVRVGDINGGCVDASSMKRIAQAIADKFAKTYLRGGEVLLTLVGTIGRTAVVSPDLVGANVARAVGVIPLAPELRPQWIEYWFRSPRVRNEMIRRSHEVARKTLNLEDVRSAPVALPPVVEQVRVQDAVELHESVCDSSSLQVSESTRRVDVLRSAVLRQAFAGRLLREKQDWRREPQVVQAMDGAVR